MAVPADDPADMKQESPAFPTSLTHISQQQQ